MSPRRHPRKLTAEQEPFLVARSFAVTYGSGSAIPQHRHTWHQLLHACSGAMTVVGGRTTWMVPPGRAVLIPAGIEHSIHMWGEVAMRSLCFPSSLNTAVLGGTECRVISVTPFLRELILRIVELSGLDSRVEQDSHLMSVLLDELQAATPNQVSLPLPADPRAAKAATYVLKHPADSLKLDVLARQCGLGARTLERLFRRDTGMCFSLWRQKARLLESLSLLVQDKSVTNAALESGYTSVSAYIAAFKGTFGCTPRTIVANTLANLTIQH